MNIYWLTVISIPVIWYQCTYTDSILERPWHAVQLQYVTVSNSGNKILITSSWGGVNYLPRSFLAEVDVFVFVSSLSEVSLPLSLKNSTESWHRTFLVRITVFNFFYFKNFKETLTTHLFYKLYTIINFYTYKCEKIRDKLKTNLFDTENLKNITAICHSNINIWQGKI